MGFFNVETSQQSDMSGSHITIDLCIYIYIHSYTYISYYTQYIYLLIDVHPPQVINRIGTVFRQDIPLFVLAFVLMSTFCACFLGKTASWTQSRRLLGTSTNLRGSSVEDVFKKRPSLGPMQKNQHLFFTFFCSGIFMCFLMGFLTSDLLPLMQLLEEQCHYWKQMCFFFQRGRHTSHQKLTKIHILLYCYIISEGDYQKQ